MVNARFRPEGSGLTELRRRMLAEDTALPVLSADSLAVTGVVLLGGEEYVRYGGLAIIGGVPTLTGCSRGYGGGAAAREWLGGTSVRQVAEISVGVTGSVQVATGDGTFEGDVRLLRDGDLVLFTGSADGTTTEYPYVQLSANSMAGIMAKTPDASVAGTAGIFAQDNGAFVAATNTTAAGFSSVTMQATSTEAFLELKLQGKVAGRLQGPTAAFGIGSTGGGLVTYQLPSTSGTVALTSDIALGGTGPTGAAGKQGSAGAQGAIGPQGDTGPTGSVGAQGVAGAQGFTGANGAAGAQGATGPVGAQGAAGAQGFTGFTGPTGRTGPQGFTGPVGAQGSQGFTGAIGPQGTQGFTGPAGPQGFTGATGPTAAPGATTQVAYNNAGALHADGRVTRTAGATPATVTLTVGATSSASSVGQVALQRRNAGNTTTYTTTIEPASTTSANRTITLPNSSSTLSVVGHAHGVNVTQYQATPVATTGAFTVTQNCAANETVVGGGCESTTGASISGGVIVKAIVRNTPNSTGTGWICGFANQTGASISASTYAICISDNTANSQT